jgi:hypothetical protein
VLVSEVVSVSSKETLSEVERDSTAEKLCVGVPIVVERLRLSETLTVPVGDSEEVGEVLREPEADKVGVAEGEAVWVREIVAESLSEREPDGVSVDVALKVKDRDNDIE